MSAKLKAVLFDLDGTLLDTAPEFYEIISAQLKEHGAEPIAFADFRTVVSDGARGMVQKAFGMDPSAPQFEPLRLEFLDLYRQHLGAHTQLFPGMADTLAFIEKNNLRWGVVTNKPVGFSAPLMQHLDLAKRCATLICPDHVKQRKPDPEALLLACSQINCAVTDAIYIGDHRRDIECAQRAGMPSIACDYGYIHADDPCTNWNADFIVSRADAIVPILQNFIC
ncbi:MAG: HAD family hydrolase [Spongiibacteraceae bacterium]